MSAISNISRRSFLASSAVAGGLMLGFGLPFDGALSGDSAAPDALNAFVRVARDGTTTVMLSRSEMGQGVYTSVAMTIADEMEADFDRIRVESVTMPHVKDYWTPGYNGMGTGGSRSIRECWPILRRAGATAREMLVEAAARRWNVLAAECRAQNGEVIHSASGRRLDFGALAADASKLRVPQDPALKPREQWRLMGQDIPQLDIPLKVTGKATYGIDVALPGLLSAATLQCPVHGGSVASMDDTEVRRIAGVRHVVQEDSFVAVIADDYWTARRGLDALSVEWREPEWVDRDNAALYARLRAGFDGPMEKGPVVGGDVAAALERADAVIEAEYDVPYLAHTCMEPINCTAQILPDRCVLWGPFQTQGWAQGIAAKLTGFALEQVEVNTTFLGGGFGRKFLAEYVAQAVLIAQAAKGRPVRMIWSREEDIGQGHFRPAAVHRARVGVNAQGMPVAWEHRLAQPSILARWLPDRDEDLTQLERIAARSWPQPMLAKRSASMRGVDPTSTMGFANRPFYATPDRSLDVAHVRSRVPVGIWRGVGNTGDAFVFESMIDELAHNAGKDPYEFRRALLAQSPRHLAVLDMAAEQAGWGTSLPEGRYQGIAIDQSFGGICAQVVEISVSDDGIVKAHRIVAVLDCGTIVNMNAVIAQVQGATLQGLSSALLEQVVIEDGRVADNNFNRYRVLTLADAPRVDVHVVKSTEAPGGAGEPALPPVAPAVANAVFAATGKRIRSLPILKHDLARG